jgi:hypothetical protein
MKKLHELSGALLEYWYFKAIGKDVRLVTYDGDLTVYENVPDETDVAVNVLGNLRLINSIIDEHEISLMKTQFDWAVPQMEHGNFTACIAYGETREIAALRYVIYLKLGTKDFEEVAVSEHVDSPEVKLRKLANRCGLNCDWYDKFEIEEFEDPESQMPVFAIKPEGGSIEDMFAEVFDNREYAELLAILTPYKISRLIEELFELRKLKEKHNL